MTAGLDRFQQWWDANGAQYRADACHMSEYHMASVVWAAALSDIGSIRDAALEEAAVMCENMTEGHPGDEWDYGRNSGLWNASKAIRALKNADTQESAEKSGERSRCDAGAKTGVGQPDPAESAPGTTPNRGDIYRDFCRRLNSARIAMNDAAIRKVLDEIDGHFHSMQGGH